ncbi:MAG: hypothetical protein PSU94_13570 [Lacunisphaera sp.]|nr:hypothetical protein [Lacunisphaera sp.]
MLTLGKTAPLFLLLTVLAAAQTDPAAGQKQQQDLERRERRETQKIDQAEEQERIKLRTRERDELAKVQREGTVAAGTATAAVIATGSLMAADMTKFAQLKFAEDEVRNLIQNQLTPEMTARFQRERNAVSRKFTLERAKLDAQQITEGEDAAKQRDRAVKTAELSAKFQEQTDDLAVEQAGEEAKLRFAHTTKINAAERDLAALTGKHLMEQTQKGSAAAYNPAADPEFTKLSAVRDAVRSALETALDELRAKFNARRTDVDNAKEDEMAKLNG